MTDDEIYGLVLDNYVEANKEYLGKQVEECVRRMGLCDMPYDGGDMGQRLNARDIVKHFKRSSWLASHPGGDRMMYVYVIDGIAKHTETSEKMVVYRALYESRELGARFNEMFVRPYDMFMGEVDRQKYPDAEQKYRFEKVDREADGIDVRR